MLNLKHYIQEAVPFIFTTTGVAVLTLALMQSCQKQVNTSAAPAMQAEHYKDAKGEPQLRWVDSKKEKK